MSSVLHHLASGIHPGAFVQSSAPVTTDVQDHVLWIDTSTSAPYALKMWDATSGVWLLVGMLGQAPTPSAPRQPGQTLTLAPQGMHVVPQWEPCCGDAALPAIPPTSPGADDPVYAARARCGAALEMAGWLEQYYANAHDTLDMLLTSAIFLTPGILFRALVVAIPPLAAIASVAVKVDRVSTAVNLIRGRLNINFFPPLTTAQKFIVAQTFYCALPAGISSFTITQDVMDQVENNLVARDSAFTANQEPLLLRLIEVPSLATWQELAAIGAQSPSTQCSEFVCNAGKAMQGGGSIGMLGHSLSGGATLGNAVRASMQGGALIGAFNTASLSGGATIG